MIGDDVTFNASVSIHIECPPDYHIVLNEQNTLYGRPAFNVTAPDTEGYWFDGDIWCQWDATSCVVNVKDSDGEVFPEWVEECNGEVNCVLNVNLSHFDMMEYCQDCNVTAVNQSYIALPCLPTWIHLVHVCKESKYIL